MGCLNELCCARNEGGPLEAAVQAEASNYRKRLGSKALVVSVTEKAWLDHVKCVAERRMIEPLRKGRKSRNDVKTGRESLARDESGRYLFTDPGGVRLRGGVKLQQVLARNVGTSPAILREDTKWQTHKVQRTDAWVRGGLARSSEEGQ